MLFSSGQHLDLVLIWISHPDVLTSYLQKYRNELDLLILDFSFEAMYSLSDVGVFFCQYFLR